MRCCKQTEQARLNCKIVPKRKKKFISKALLVALKKDLRLSRLYSDLEICWANFKTLSRIQVAARALKIGFMRKTTVPTCITFLVHFFDIHCAPFLRAKISVLIWPAIEAMAQRIHPRMLCERMPGSYSQPSWVIPKEPRAVGRRN